MRLIAGGVTLQAFKALAEVAFVRAASREARLRNARISQSSLAAITGLSRGQIRALVKKQNAGEGPPTDLIPRVILGWLTDFSFANKKSPRPLSLKEPEDGFYELVRRYGGDITPKALLRELTRRNLVQVNKDTVELKHDEERGQRSSNSDGICVTLSEALRPPSSQRKGGSVRSIHLHKEFPSMSRKESAILRKRTNQLLRAFFADIQSAIDAIEVGAGAKKVEPAGKSKISIVLIAQE